jgi:hypothetical protein
MAKVTGGQREKLIRKVNLSGLMVQEYLRYDQNGKAANPGNGIRR